MVKIIQGIEVASNGKQIPYLKLNGMEFNIKIIDDEIYVLAVDNDSHNVSLKKLESNLAKIRGYYGHINKFNELREFCENTISHVRDQHCENITVGEDSTRFPISTEPSLQSDRCETDRESRVRRLRDDLMVAEGCEPPTPDSVMSTDGNLLSVEDVNSAVEFAREVQRDRNIDDEVDDEGDLM